MNVVLDQHAHALLVIKEGRKFIHAVALFNPPVRVMAIPKGDTRWFRNLERRGAPYPVARAARKFLAAGRSLGITKSARQALKAALTQETKP